MMVERKRTWTEEEIVDLLRGSNLAVERAMLRLYERQVAIEKATSESRLLNTVGFCAFSARSGSKFARVIAARARKGIPAGRRLYGEWLARAREIAIRHRRQLLELANAG